MNKNIFLDCDGVLNTENYPVRFQKNPVDSPTDFEEPATMTTLKDQSEGGVWGWMDVEEGRL